MNGGFPKQELATSIKPEALDQRFEDYELLLDLHFILKPDVVEFVESSSPNACGTSAPKRKPSPARNAAALTDTSTGVNRQSPVLHQSKRPIVIRHRNRSEGYDIPENIVLKRLLSIIYTTLRDADEYLKGNYDWVTDRWQANTDLIDQVQRTVERNVHIRRIRDPGTYEPTERMLTTAANSRQEIYRDAATLLRARQELFDGDPDALRTLLSQTAITPDDQARLFELYVLFRFITTLEDLQDTQPVFQTIKSGRQEIAKIDGEQEIVLYHDTSASDRGLSFRTEATPNNREPTRAEQVQQTARDVASTYFD